MKHLLKAGNRQFDLATPICMGVLNVTPDSFSDRGNLAKNEAGPFIVDIDKVLYKVESFLDQGASVVDVGGESTRPGSHGVPLDEELERTIPVIEAVRKNLDVCLSIDTSSPTVMAEAVSAGAELINDVRALSSPGAIEVAANSSAAVCLMHMSGQPINMQESLHYDNVVKDVSDYLRERAKTCIKAGDFEHRLLVDPGFGFGKSVIHNYKLLKYLSAITELGFPVLVGLSRKSMVGEVVNRPTKERVSGSVAASTLALNNGASVIRSHDVAATMDAIGVHCAYRDA